MIRSDSVITKLICAEELQAKLFELRMALSRARAFFNLWKLLRKLDVDESL